MNYTYPKTYKNKPVTEQLTTLQSLFPELKNAKGDINLETEIETEGTFVIPHYRLFGTYNEAVEKVLEALKSSRTCYNWRDGKWTGNYLKQLPVKEQFWSKQDDVIVICGQFGLQHAGKSVKTVRETVQDNELPFGIYEVAIMLLTHPERLQDYDDLWIDCPGDEYSWNGDGVFSGAPIFCFSDGRLGFDALDVSIADGSYGSASGFVPQALEIRPLEAFESSPLDPSALTDEIAIEHLKKNGYKITKMIEKEF